MRVSMYEDGNVSVEQISNEYEGENRKMHEQGENSC